MVIDMNTCVIFGGNGFIGSHLAEALVGEGYNVKVFDTFRFGSENLSGIVGDIEVIRGDFLNETDVKFALEDADCLFHYISTTNPATAAQNPVYDIESNVIGSVRLLQQAIDSNVEKVFFSSSGGTIYGETDGGPIPEQHPLNPVNPYAISKLAIEKYLHSFNHNYGLDYCILRYSNPYGERQNPRAKQGVIPIFLNKIRNNERPLIYGDGTAIRDYIYIKDAIEATIAVVKSQTDKHVFNVGSGEGHSLNQLIDTMSSVTRREIDPEYVENSGIYISKIVLDITRIRQETGWMPQTDLRDGIEKTWEWISGLLN
jgi:UDP-glucose 4-epimerase